MQSLFFAARTQNVLDCLGAEYCVVDICLVFVLMQNIILDETERAGTQKTPSENHRKELKFRRIPLSKSSALAPRSLSRSKRVRALQLARLAPQHLAPQRPPQQGSEGVVTWTSG